MYLHTTPAYIDSTLCIYDTYIHYDLRYMFLLHYSAGFGIFTLSLRCWKNLGVHKYLKLCFFLYQNTLVKDYSNRLHNTYILYFLFLNKSCLYFNLQTDYITNYTHNTYYKSKSTDTNTFFFSFFLFFAFKSIFGQTTLYF